MEPACVICQDNPKSLLHLLRDCEFARRVWSLSPIASVVQQGSTPIFQDWFFQVSSSLSTKNLDLFAIIYWNIWYAGNKLLWNQEDPLDDQLVRISVAYWSHYLRLKRKLLLRETEVTILKYGLVLRQDGQTQHWDLALSHRRQNRYRLHPWR